MIRTYITNFMRDEQSVWCYDNAYDDIMIMWLMINDDNNNYDD